MADFSASFAVKASERQDHKVRAKIAKRGNS
jgi:hypothetical protein